MYSCLIVTTWSTSVPRISFPSMGGVYNSGPRPCSFTKTRIPTEISACTKKKDKTLKIQSPVFERSGCPRVHPLRLHSSITHCSCHRSPDVPVGGEECRGRPVRSTPESSRFGRLTFPPPYLKKKKVLHFRVKIYNRLLFL